MSVGNGAQLRAEPAQQGFDPPGDRLAVLQRARRMERDAHGGQRRVFDAGRLVTRASDRADRSEIGWLAGELALEPLDRIAGQFGHARYAERAAGGRSP